jgi:predicted DCC family thiol-disulfide oxidoreductase YuxK
MKVVIFDSSCNICNRFTRFLLWHKNSVSIKLTDFNSEYTKNYSTVNNKLLDINKIHFINNNIEYEGLDAIIQLLYCLSYWYIILIPFTYLPIKIKLLIYNVVAKNRYIFGISDYCILNSQSNFLK